jgi:CDP-diacylglycerol--serine O-phosphatidyltransferase
MYAGITMVSSVPFYSFKEINLKRAVPFYVVALFAASLAVVALKPSVVLFLLFLAYALSGYVLWGLKRRAKPAV